MAVPVLSPLRSLTPLVATFADFFEAYLAEAQGYEMGGVRGERLKRGPKTPLLFMGRD